MQMKDGCEGLGIVFTGRNCCRSAVDDVQVLGQAGHLQHFPYCAIARSKRHECNAALFELLEGGNQQANPHRR